MSVTPFGKTPFGNLFQSGRRGVSRPPVFGNLLVWIRGIVELDTQLTDYAKALGDFPMQMVGGPCLTFNGVDDKCTTSSDHGTIVSYEGTSTLSYDGTDLTGTAGTFYNLLFSDGTHFPCIGKTDTVNPTSTFAIDGTEMSIVSLDYAAIWAGTQDSYFYEMANGYAERENLAFDTRILTPEWVYTNSEATISADGFLEGYPSYLIEPYVSSLDYMRLGSVNQPDFEVGVKYYISFFIDMHAGGSYNFRGSDVALDGRANFNSVTKETVLNQGTNCTLADAGYVEISGTLVFVSFSLTRVNMPASGDSYGAGNRRTGEGSFNIARYQIAYQQDSGYAATAGYIVEGRQPTPIDVAKGWNNPQNKFQFPYSATMETQDNLEGPFWYTTGTPNPKTQAEFEAYVVGKAASFFCTERGGKFYNQILTGIDLTVAQGDCP